MAEHPGASDGTPSDADSPVGVEPGAASTGPDAELDAVAEELYGLLPDEFVAGRDAAVTAARERGAKELARAIGRLRRPTRAAWLANLLARHRAPQLATLLQLATGLADAQRTLDGTALRQLSRTRHQLVAAMSREAGKLAQEAGDPAAESVLRELQGILEAALARPELAPQVRSGRLTRTLSYTGFGPDAEPDAVPTSPARVPAVDGAARGARTDQDDSGNTDSDSDSDQQRQRDEHRLRIERLRLERDRRAAALTTAQDEEDAAVARQHAEHTAWDDALGVRQAARDEVAELATQLQAARERERATTVAAREAEAAAKAAIRAAGAAATRTERARARLAEVEDQLDENTASPTSSAPTTAARPPSAEPGSP